MSELKKRVKELEQLAAELKEFITEINRQIDAGEMTRELAEEIVAREYSGTDPQVLLTQTEEKLTRMRAELAPPIKSLHVGAMPIAVFLVLGILGLYSFTTITGLITFDTGETFYTLPITQTVTANTVIPLPITDLVTSVRLNGRIEGQGRATVWLAYGTQRSIIAQFDSTTASSPGGVSPLTGLVTVEDPSNITNDAVVVNDTNVANDIVVVNDTNVTNETGLTVGIASDPVVLTPTPQTPIPVEAAPELIPSANVRYERACVDTCTLPTVAPPFKIEVDADEGVTVQLDSIIYGVRFAVNETVPAFVQTTTSDNASGNNSNETPVTPVTILPTPEPTTPTTPVTITTPDATPNSTGLSEGSACTADSACASGICKTDFFQGALQEGICTSSRAVCTIGNQTYVPNVILNDSVCAASPVNAGWIVRDGRGRFAIRAPDGFVIATIDKYGMMAVHGGATFSTVAGNDGWIVRDATNSSRLSIDSAGALLASGTLTERGTPMRTGNGDFIVKNTAGVIVATITREGAVSLAGDLLPNASIP